MTFTTRRECMVGGLATAVSLALSGCGDSKQNANSTQAATPNFSGTSIAGLELVITRSGGLTPLLPMRLERLDVARLDELRAQEDLDAVVVGAATEFERILLLKEWVAAQWPAGTPDPYPPWDAITVLDWIRRGITGGFCGQYAQLLLQSLASFGINARYVEIGKTDNPYAHFVTEVWSADFDKWVMMDADYNVHFESAEGRPLSALEIHDALVTSRIAEITAVKGTLRPGHDDPAGWPLNTAELYYYYRVLLKGDHLSAPDEPPFARFNDAIEWLDAATVPWESSTVESPYAKERLTNLQSDDRQAFANGPNRVLLSLESQTSSDLRFTLTNNVPQFLGYQVRLDDDEPFEHDSSTLIWTPTTLNPRIEVRAVNVRGVPGPAASARFKSRHQRS